MKTIARKRAIEILMQEIPKLSNSAMAAFLDRIADSGQSEIVSKFDRFTVLADWADDRKDTPAGQ